MAHNIRRFNVVLPPIHRPYRMLPIGSTAVLINAMVNHRMRITAHLLHCVRCVVKSAGIRRSTRNNPHNIGFRYQWVYVISNGHELVATSSW